MRLTLLILACLNLPLGLAGEAKTLRIGIADSWSMPFYQQLEGQNAEGIVVELDLLLGKHLQRPVELILTPRNRMPLRLLSGQIDVICYQSPEWFGADAAKFTWSVPLISQRDVIATTALVNSELPIPHGSKLGAVLGYAYPALTNAFAQGQWVRDDARRQELTLRKLIIGRYDYALSNELSLAWINRAQPAGKKLHVIEYLPAAQVGCMVDPKGRDSQQILQALKEIKSSGRIDEILSHYR